MKIAIMYSGAIRHLASTLRNNLLCFDYCDTIDLYFSTWSHIGYADKINSPDYVAHKKVILPNTEISEELIEEIVSYSVSPAFLKSKITVKNIKIEQYDPINYKLDLINGTDNPGLHAQYYKILDCFNLLDNTINYDMLIRCRGDIVIGNNDKEFLLKSVLDNKIIFPSKIWFNHIYNKDVSLSINEMLWVSNKELMTKACSIYNNVDKINDVIKTMNTEQLNFGERITYLNLKAENMIDNIQTFDFDYNILR